MRRIFFLFLLTGFLDSSAQTLSPRTDSSVSDRIVSWIDRYPDVHIAVDRPAHLRKGRPTRVLFYALPNGNTIEWTAGKTTGEQDDWHYDIQHIAAQTRYLRQTDRRCNYVTVYLMAKGKSWGAWRTLHAQDKTRILPAIVDDMLRCFASYRPTAVLSSHSGGGYFLFEYIRAVDRIPDSIERFVFLDSTYGYQDSLHVEKLTEWLLRKQKHRLCVTSYEDATVILNGKHIVSQAGGTWGRSFAMAADLGQRLALRRGETDDFVYFDDAEKQVFFKLKKNPAGEIYHTVLVERNGFIDTVQEGTPKAERGYRFWGPRAYEKFIDDRAFRRP